MALEFLRCVQVLLLAGYDDIILKVKQVICLESLYFKKDFVAVLPTGYGKSLVLQLLPRLLREREEIRATTSVKKSVVLVVSPLNALMYDQISKLRARGVVLKHDFSAKTTESSDIPLSPCLSKFVTVTIKNPVTPPFRQIFLPPRF